MFPLLLNNHKTTFFVRSNSTPYRTFEFVYEMLNILDCIEIMEYVYILVCMIIIHHPLV